jgi:hypothetical protein
MITFLYDNKKNIKYKVRHRLLLLKLKSKYILKNNFISIHSSTFYIIHQLQIILYLKMYTNFNFNT